MSQYHQAPLCDYAALLGAIKDTGKGYHTLLNRMWWQQPPKTFQIKSQKKIPTKVCLLGTSEHFKDCMSQETFPWSSPFLLEPVMGPGWIRSERREQTPCKYTHWEKAQPPWQHDPLQLQLWFMNIITKPEQDIITVSDSNTQAPKLQKNLVSYLQGQRPLPH